MVSVISAVVAVCVVITTVVSVGKMKKNDSVDSTSVSSTTTNPTDISTTSAQAASTTENTADLLKSQLVGKWMDSAGMSGYEFFENGSANVTYVNLTVPVINMPINGTAKGTYTLDGNTLTVQFSIYTKTIKNSFTVSVENNMLTLINRDDGEKSTYLRQSYEQESSSS